MIAYVVLWLNVFPAKNGISREYCPCEIISGHRLDYKKHCQLDFGKYCKVHDEPTPLNGMKSRTYPCITLGTMGNLQGTYKFMDVNMGKKLKKRRWTAMPMPESVIRSVERIAEKEKRKPVERKREEKTGREKKRKSKPREKRQKERERERERERRMRDNERQ